MELSRADQVVSPPRLEIPRHYNAAYDLIERNLRAGRGDKLAYIDDRGRYTYRELGERVNRAGNALRALGLAPEQRVLLALHDGIDFPTVFLGAIKAGLVPIAVNTMLTANDYRFILGDSRANALVVSPPLLATFEQALAEAGTELRREVIVAGEAQPPQRSLDALLAGASDVLEPAPTTGDDACFWLYSSGSTGAPKGTVHVHASMIQTAELYARPVLGIGEDDVVFSAAKLFFAYGLGNALSFPLAVGATTVLMAERATPAAVFKRLTAHRATIFYGVPTLFAAMLSASDFPAREALALRRCASAGEPLPAEIGRRFRERTGVDILDGIGSTEMLHIFLSNRADDVRYGTTGKPVPGYELRIIDEQGHDVADGEPGELLIKGPTAAMTYWNNRPKSRATFLGEWTRSGDKYRLRRGRLLCLLRAQRRHAQGRRHLGLAGGGRSGDHRPSRGARGGRGRRGRTPTSWSSPRPLSCSVLPRQGDAALAAEIQAHVRAQLAHYKYPRWIDFVPELPKTATGKIQRYKLRALR